MRRTFLTDRIQASTRAANGMTVYVDLNSIPPRDSMGRFAHVLGLAFAGTYRFTTAAANDALLGRNMLALWSNIFLEDVGGWIYAGGIDGRDVRDDQFFRTWIVDGGSGSTNLALNVGAGNNDIEINLVWSFIRNDRRGEQSFDGAIPLAALQQKTGALRFSAGNSIPGVAAAGITFAGFQGTILVYADVVYLPAIVLPGPWQVETYTISELSGSLRHPDRMHEHITLRHKVGDNGGENVDDYGPLTVTVNGDVQVAALSQAEMARRDTYMVTAQDSMAFGAMTLTTILPFTNTSTQNTGQLLIPQSKSRDAMAAGQVGFQYVTRTRTSSRFLHRTIACHRQQGALAILEAAGCPRGAAMWGLAPGGIPVFPKLNKTLVVQPQTGYTANPRGLI